MTRRRRRGTGRSTSDLRGIDAPVSVLGSGLFNPDACSADLKPGPSRLSASANPEASLPRYERRDRKPVGLTEDDETILG